MTMNTIITRAIGVSKVEAQAEAEAEAEAEAVKRQQNSLLPDTLRAMLTADDLMISLAFPLLTPLITDS